MQEKYKAAVQNLHRTEESRVASLFLPSRVSSKEDWQLLGTHVMHELCMFDFLQRLTNAVLAESSADRDVATRQCLLAVKCIDPDQLSDLLKSLGTGIIAVISTLRSRLVYSASLGLHIGHVMSASVLHLYKDTLDKLSQENRRWADTGMRSACNLISIASSFYLARTMNAFSSAMHGSTALTKALTRYLSSQKNKLEGERSALGKVLLSLPEQVHGALDNQEDMVIWMIAIFGLSYQVRNRFQAPLILKLPLAPLYVLENLLGRLSRSRIF
jgi:hypothetical protein